MEWEGNLIQVEERKTKGPSADDTTKVQRKYHFKKTILHGYQNKEAQITSKQPVPPRRPTFFKKSNVPKAFVKHKEEEEEEEEEEQVPPKPAYRPKLAKPTSQFVPAKKELVAQMPAVPSKHLEEEEEEEEEITLGDDEVCQV